MNTGAWVEEIYSGSCGTQSGHPGEVRQVEEGPGGGRGVRHVVYAFFPGSTC